VKNPIFLSLDFTDLSTSQGKKHSTPDLTKDIDTLMASLKVYVYSEGCVLDNDEEPAADIISVGLATLTHGSEGNSLDEFNAQLNQAREQCQIEPVLELLHHLNQPVEVSTSSLRLSMSALMGDLDLYPQVFRIQNAIPGSAQVSATR
jgi:hypothetical protein